MTKTFNVASDIRAFQSGGDVDFHTRHVAIIGTSEEKEIPNRAFKQILKRAMDLGISDLAMQHDHYLYGTDKR
jgi:alkyl hydroperoxide reductase subunit AhpC